ncbi:MAG: hypothetical protein ABR975_06115 [Vulcanimicrobiaceae bacterium]
MFVAASVVSTRLDLLRRRWRIEGGIPPVPGARIDPRRRTSATLNIGSVETPRDLPLTWRKDDYVVRGADDARSNLTGERPFRGTFVIYDLTSGKVAWREEWGEGLVTPMGFTFADDALYVADGESACIFVIDVLAKPSRIVRRISNPAFNDCHGIVRTSRGLLVACTGSDGIVEVDLDGNTLWEWWAAEHGFATAPSGHVRESGRGIDHRGVQYHTRYQATHLNSVAFADPDERFVLTTLFHQGLLIRIDRNAPERAPEILLDGLARPHAIRRLPDGWSLANSWAQELILLDERFQVTHRYAADGGWIQDCIRLSDGTFLIDDVDEHRLTRVAGPPFRPLSTTTYDGLWRVYAIEELPHSYQAAFDLRETRTRPSVRGTFEVQRDREEVGRLAG